MRTVTKHGFAAGTAKVYLLWVASMYLMLAAGTLHRRPCVLQRCEAQPPVLPEPTSDPNDSADDRDRDNSEYKEGGPGT
jgi:hypothetical protein